MPANSKVSRTNDDDVDPKLQNGPLGERHCTDPLCCLLFLGFIGAMIGIAGYALSEGNPTIIGRGYDSDGKMCGIDEGYENYPYLYWPYPSTTKEYRLLTVCVSECPTVETTTLEGKCMQNSLFTRDCDSQDGGHTTSLAKVGAMASGLTVTPKEDPTNYNFYIYNTVGFLNRFCVPAVEEFKEAAKSMFDSELLENWISDIRETWQVILGSMGLAFIIGFVYMVLLRYCSGVLTWSAILAFIVGMAVLGWRFYKNATDIEDVSEGTGTTEGDAETTTKKTINSEKIIAYVCFGVAGATVLAVLCLWSRIRLAIAILKAAADYVKDTPSVFLVPIVTCVFLVCLFGYWGLTAVYLVSCGDAGQMKNYPVGDFEFDKTLQRLLILHLFGLLWFNAFIIAASQFVLASSACMWYFSQGSGQATPKTIRTSVYRLFRYHFGSIAFGSLLLAIIQMIRIILAYMQHQAEKLKGKEGKFIQYLVGCLQCYAECFERFIKKLNKNAYIQIALRGENFCTSALAGIKLIANNPIRFTVVGGIASIFILFGKVFVASMTALAGFLIITNSEKFDDSLSSPFIPTIVIFIFAYVIAAVFMTVYGMAGDAIFQCFILDEQIHSKRNSPPLHCPESLKEFLDKYKKD